MCLTSKKFPKKQVTIIHFADSIPRNQKHGYTASKKSLTASKTQMQLQRKPKLISEMTHPTKEIAYITFKTWKIWIIYDSMIVLKRFKTTNAFLTKFIKLNY